MFMKKIAVAILLALGTFAFSASFAQSKTVKKVNIHKPGLLRATSKPANAQVTKVPPPKAAIAPAKYKPVNK